MHHAMRVTSPADAEAANGRFNYFHDGFLRRIQVTSTNLEEMPDGDIVELQICHNNYDCPNQPRDRAVLVCGICSGRIHENLIQFLGSDIFDLRFVAEAGRVSCLLTYHRRDQFVRSLENGTQIVLFESDFIEIEETTYSSLNCA
jgi:hypothetical protein